MQIEKLFKKVQSLSESPSKTYNHHFKYLTYQNQFVLKLKLRLCFSVSRVEKRLQDQEFEWVKTEKQTDWRIRNQYHALSQAKYHQHPQINISGITADRREKWIIIINILQQEQTKTTELCVVRSCGELLMERLKLLNRIKAGRKYHIQYQTVKVCRH